MQKLLVAYLIEQAKPLCKGERQRTPVKVLVGMGHNRWTWYSWLEKPLFLDWWNKSLVDNYYTKTGLMQVYEAIKRRACGNSPQDAKTYLDRFDDDFKPQTAQEHGFKGIEPADEQQVKDARALSESKRKAIESKDISNEAPVVASTHNDEQDAV